MTLTLAANASAQPAIPGPGATIAVGNGVAGPAIAPVGMPAPGRGGFAQALATLQAAPAVAPANAANPATVIAAHGKFQPPARAGIAASAPDPAATRAIADAPILVRAGSSDPAAPQIRARATTSHKPTTADATDPVATPAITLDTPTPPIAPVWPALAPPVAATAAAVAGLPHVDPPVSNAGRQPAPAPVRNAAAVRPDPALAARLAAQADPSARLAGLTAPPVTPRSSPPGVPAPAHDANDKPAGTALASLPAPAPALPAAGLPTSAMPAHLQPAVAKPAGVTTAEAPTDFATLVDNIARARSDASANTARPVGVTLNHADFGRISLQITPREAGLAVTMRSVDPGFAPAVAAAANTHRDHQPGQRSDPQSGLFAPGTPDPPGVRTHDHSAEGRSDQAPRGDTTRQSPRHTQAANFPISGRPDADSNADDDAGIFA